MKKIYFLIPFGALMAGSCTSEPDYDATGIFEATTVTVAAETPGRIVEFGLSEGDTLGLGQTIATVDTAMLSLQLKELRSRRLSAEGTAPDIAAQAAALRTRIAHQEREVERFSRLLADGATTRKQVDDARAQLSQLRGELGALLSSLGKSRSSISENALALQYQADQIEEQIRRSTVKAPMAGIVLDKLAEPGEYATPGKPLVRLADMSHVYLRSYFTAEQLANLSVGQEVTVIADFGGDERHEYAGRITWIAEESEFTPKSIQTSDTRANLVYAVKIAVENDGRLKLGQYGEVRL